MRSFSEVALCHLPSEEIDEVHRLLEVGFTSVYANEAGLFVWTGATQYTPPILTKILESQSETYNVDYVLFDVDVEPTPDLEIFHG